MTTTQNISNNQCKLLMTFGMLELDRTRCDKKADFFEEVGNVLLTPFRFVCGGAAKVNNKLEIIHAEKYDDVVKKIILICALILIFPLSFLALSISIGINDLSDTYEDVAEIIIEDKEMPKPIIN